MVTAKPKPLFSLIPCSLSTMESYGSPSYLGSANFLDIEMLDGSTAFGNPWTYSTDELLPAHAVSLATHTPGEAAAHGPTTSMASEMNRSEYESGCPYYEGASLDLPKFRLVEQFTDDQVYIGDSYGGGSYIDIDETRPCSLDCRCRGPESDFVFIAYKSSSGLLIDFHDLSLCNEVVAVTGETAILESEEGVGIATTFDGLAVLAKYEQLRQHLESHPSLNADPSRAVLALSLLVDSFLTDREIFRSFGYENLYERGFLSFEHWKEFQRSQLDDDITLLDDSFTAFAEARTWSTLDDAAGGVIGAPGDIPVDSSDAGLTSDLPEEGDSDTPAETPSPLQTVLQSDLASHTLDRSTLLEAASRGDESAVRLFLDRGADANESGWLFSPTPLEKAAEGGHESTVRLLLDRGARIDGVSGRYSTPLGKAAEGGHESTVRLLLDRGARIDGVSGRYSTPLGKAAEGGHESTVRLLLDRGARIDGVSGNYTTPLGKAAEGGHKSMVRLLLNRSAITPLELAADGGHESTVRLLLDRGARIDGVSGRYSTPLGRAAEEGRESMVRLLLDRGASIDGVSGNYATPLELAVMNGHKSTVQLLLGRGGSAGGEHKVFERAAERGWKDIAPRLFWCSLKRPGRVPSQRHRTMFVRMLIASKRHEETPLRQSHRQVTTCYHAFVQEFGRIKNSLSLHGDGMAWVGDQFLDPQKAWRAGIRTLRNIAGGRLPQDIEEVMAFLCVCKAASATLDLLTDSEYTARFFADLPRWSILFDNFDIYKDAVRRIWDYDLLDALDGAPCHAADADLLLYAQGLVSSLVGETGMLIGLAMGGRPDGLAQSQQRWRERHPPPVNEDPDSAKTKPPDILPEEKNQLQREISNDFSTRISEKLVILMTGAIFAILLIFLYWIRNWVPGNSEATMLVLPSPTCSKPICSRAAFLGCCGVLEAYLGLRVNAREFEPTLTPSLQSVAAESRQAFSVDSAPPAGGHTLSRPSSRQSGDQENTKDPVDVEYGVGRNLVFVFSARHAAVSAAGDGALSKVFVCDVCRKSFSTSTNRQRHMQEKHTHGGKKHQCAKCGKRVLRKGYLKKGHKCRN
ncbi:hypothetical protein B0T18DRAFT_137752 [Schizothecium vesticola]|uniref:C2H2-type domain-containing protein n=1 Tax=Schizothecium vesticola TaxID=314040 RepID=A0AA40EUR3_9PEZI|nr:hypothetical protein B0T18DRAFT_137752 [Schizothecium vesticola]